MAVRAVPLSCEVCARPFQPKHSLQRRCGRRECFSIARTRRMRVTGTVMVTCRGCQGTFEVERRTGRRPEHCSDACRRAAWVLVPVFLVWSNLHSGFIIGAGFLGLVIVAEGAAGLLGVPGAAPPARVRELAWVGVACLAVVVVNPNGPGIYLYPFQTQGSAAQQALILEWQSPDFHDWEVRTFELMLVSLALMVAANRRITPGDAVLALGATVLSLQSVRHIALFVAAATPVWIRQAELTRLRLAGWWTARRRTGRRWVPHLPA